MEDTFLRIQLLRMDKNITFIHNIENIHKKIIDLQIIITIKLIV